MGRLAAELSALAVSRLVKPGLHFVARPCKSRSPVPRRGFCASWWPSAPGHGPVYLSGCNARAGARSHSHGPHQGARGSASHQEETGCPLPAAGGACRGAHFPGLRGKVHQSACAAGLAQSLARPAMGKFPGNLRLCRDGRAAGAGTSTNCCRRWPR